MPTALPPIDHPSSIRHRNWRRIKDLIAKHLIGIGGIGVILAVTLIFVYLLYVVFPLFLPADLEIKHQYSIANYSQAPTLYLATEEQAEIAVRFDAAGDITFFKAHNGDIVERHKLSLPSGVHITSFSSGTPNSRIVVYGLSNGEAIVLKHNYEVNYPSNVRVITPMIEYPLGEAPILVDAQRQPLVNIAIQSNEDRATLVAMTENGLALVTALTKEISFLDDEVTIESETTALDDTPSNVTHLLLDKDQRNLYLADSGGTVTSYDLSDPTEPERNQQTVVVPSESSITTFSFLAGDISLLIGDSTGTVSQWFPVRDKNNNFVLTKIRQFSLPKAISTIAPEYNRKGFIAIDQGGKMGIFHTTAERTIGEYTLIDTAPITLAITPRANAALIEDSHNNLYYVEIHNEHPEISWSALWGKIWYESYEKPDYIWQSSSASNDFEPKFSLVPISFGTIKAAFYAMLFAVPLAIFGAIYTAYFMTPKMRSLVKPTIEIMEALPTVILGFLAGLWLAPVLEHYLPAVFALILLLPIVVMGCSYAWFALPRHIQSSIPDGWQAALLIPVIIIATWLAFALSGPMEALAFGGNMRSWLDHELGIDFDQRNSLVVGIAMGFAVIPTIFSITEDAIFGVPKHLTNGSLALGATPWQTLIRVVILTASPGIFSAVMIGFGRAVGETMIVLMATGNTPVMDFSIFQGMRTLSANIAVEMPESEVDSTHYRILFLAALVLFIFTFFFNTIAELVRQRLRKKYSSL